MSTGYINYRVGIQLEFVEEREEKEKERGEGEKEREEGGGREGWRDKRMEEQRDEDNVSQMSSWAH